MAMKTIPQNVVHTLAEGLIRNACANSDPAAKASALMNEYRLASVDVQRALVMALIARVAMKGS